MKFSVKPLSRRLLAMLLALAFCLPAVSAAQAPQTDAPRDYTIYVNDQLLDLSDLPLAPYEEGGCVMVPLRKIAQALGYAVGWDSESGAITIDDQYIQKATLFDRAAHIVFTGHLKVIDMSREIDSPVETVVHSGYTYVPAEFFQEFFNDVTVEGTVIRIAPSMCELAALS